MQGALGFGLLPIGMDASDVGLSFGRSRRSWERVGGSLVGGARRGSKTCGWMMDGRAGPFLANSPINMAAGPGSRKNATGPPPLVDWFGLSRIPSIHEPGASVKIAHPTRVVKLPGSLF